MSRPLPFRLHAHSWPTLHCADDHFGNLSSFSGHLESNVVGVFSDQHQDVQIGAWCSTPEDQISFVALSQGIHALIVTPGEIQLLSEIVMACINLGASISPLARELSQHPVFLKRWHELNKTRTATITPNSSLVAWGTQEEEYVRFESILVHLSVRDADIEKPLLVHSTLPDEFDIRQATVNQLVQLVAEALPEAPYRHPTPFRR